MLETTTATSEILNEVEITSINDDRLFQLETMERAYELATPSVRFYVDTILTS